MGIKCSAIRTSFVPQILGSTGGATSREAAFPAANRNILYAATRRVPDRTNQALRGSVDRKSLSLAACVIG